MSIRKQNITFPDTLKTIEVNKDKLHQVDTIFITPSTFTMTPDEFADIDFFYSELGINIFPIHNASDFQPQDEATTYGISPLDFSYKQFNGKYRHKIKYNFSLDYHKIINDISGSKVNIIYASGNVLRACQPSEGVIKGLAVSCIELEKIIFPLNGSIGNSDLFIELEDSDELNVFGYEIEVDWTPSQVDRLALNITLSYSESGIGMFIRYLDQPIENIIGTDITLTDDVNGVLSFTFTDLLNGHYSLTNFSDSLNNGCIYIQSTLYFGLKRYNYTFVVVITNNWNTVSGDNFTTVGGDNLIFLN